MVLYVMKWDILPDKVKAYGEWAQSAIRRTVAASGVVEFRGYRPATGSSQVVVTYEFANLAAWSTWDAHEDVQQTSKWRRSVRRPPPQRPPTNMAALVFVGH